MRAWKPGDACRVVNPRIGVVLDGKIEVVHGHKMVVQTDDGQRWTVDVDSSFVQRREGADFVTPDRGTGTTLDGAA